MMDARYTYTIEEAVEETKSSEERDLELPPYRGPGAAALQAGGDDASRASSSAASAHTRWVSWVKTDARRRRLGVVALLGVAFLLALVLVVALVASPAEENMAARGAGLPNGSSKEEGSTPVALEEAPATPELAPELEPDLDPEAVAAAFASAGTSSAPSLMPSARPTAAPSLAPVAAAGTAADATADATDDVTDGAIDDATDDATDDMFLFDDDGDGGFFDGFLDFTCDVFSLFC